MTTPRSLIACLVIGMCAGCAGVTVVKDPSEYDTGIRYWRPKPYLLVTPADATGRMVNIKLQYLPDFSEEYSIRPRGGLKLPPVALEDGWNLVGVGGPPAPPKPAEPVAIPASPTDPTKLPEYVVAATNVPMGYYESVFDKSKDGTKKTLKGWRYIGLSPIAGGDAIGVDPGTAAANLPPGCPPPSASSISGPLYGMVFFNGVMTFRQLDEIANNQTCPQYVKLIPDKPVPPAPSGTINPIPTHAPPATLPIPTNPDTVPDAAPAASPETRPLPSSTLNEPNLEAVPGASTTPPPPTPSPGPGASLELTPAPDSAVARTSIAIPKPKNWSGVR